MPTLQDIKKSIYTPLFEIKCKYLSATQRLAFDLLIDYHYGNAGEKKNAERKLLGEIGATELYQWEPTFRTLNIAVTLYDHSIPHPADRIPFNTVPYTPLVPYEELLTKYSKTLH